MPQTPATAKVRGWLGSSGLAGRVESTHRTRRDDVQTPFDRKFLDGLSRTLELSEKSQFLAEEIVALDRGRPGDRASREVLEWELAQLSEERRQHSEQQKADQDADLERVRKLFFGGSST